MKVAILTLSFLPIILSGCALDNIAARQEKATGLWPELVNGQMFGQSFVSTRPNLYRIDLSTATYARTNSAPVIFHLRAAPEAETDIISVTIPGPDIQNERPTSIVFPPLPDSKGKTYYFLIEAPEAAAGNAITVYVSEADQYSDGTAYRNGAPVIGDLAFTAYSRESYTLSMILREFLSRISQDKLFFIFYSILILSVCAGLLVSLLKQAPRSKRNE
jgi:hypothetical protein